MAQETQVTPAVNAILPMNPDVDAFAWQQQQLQKLQAKNASAPESNPQAIANNVAASTPEVPSLHVAPPSPAVPPKFEVPIRGETPAPKAPESQDEKVAAAEPDFSTPPEPIEPTKEALPGDEIEDPEELKEIPSEASTINFKKLRNKTKQIALEKRELAAKALELEETVKKYQTGEILPEKLVELDQRVKQLEPYEKVFALKMSPAFQEKYVKPKAHVKSQIDAIAADYRIPKNIMDKALTIENQAELNKFLTQHFDEIGGTEVKQLIRGYQQITDAEREAENEPAEALQALEAQHEEYKAAQRAMRADHFQGTANSSWTKSLMKIKEAGKAHELILRPNDPEHNRKFVEPIQTKAAQEYGKLINTLAELGTESIPEAFAESLADMVLRAVSQSFAVESRAAAEAEAAKIRENASRRNQILRPNIGGGYGGQPPSAGAPRITAQTAAEQSLAKVLGPQR